MARPLPTVLSTKNVAAVYTASLEQTFDLAGTSATIATYAGFGVGVADNPNHIEGMGGTVWIGGGTGLFGGWVNTGLTWPTSGHEYITCSVAFTAKVVHQQTIGFQSTTGAIGGEIYVVADPSTLHERWVAYVQQVSVAVVFNGVSYSFSGPVVSSWTLTEAFYPRLAAYGVSGRVTASSPTLSDGAPLAGLAKPLNYVTVDEDGNTTADEWLPAGSSLPASVERYYQTATLKVGKLIVSAVAPPSYAGLALSLTVPPGVNAASEYNAGSFVEKPIDYPQLAGWRYLTLNLTVTVPVGTTPPAVWIGFPGINGELGSNAATAVTALASDGTYIPGIWYLIDYNRTLCAGQTQAIEIDLAHPVYGCVYGIGYDNEHMVPSYPVPTGKGVPLINSADVVGVGSDFGGPQPTRNSYTVGQTICLACDTDGVTVTASDFVVVEKTGSRMWIGTGSQWSGTVVSSVNGVDIAVDNIGTMPGVEIEMPLDSPFGSPVGGSPLIRTSAIPLILVTRDDKPAAAGLTGPNSTTLSPQTIQQFVTAMNALGNGYQWALDTEWDLSTTEAAWILPTIEDFGWDGETFGTFAESGALIIPLLFKQTVVEDYIPWWAAGKTYELQALVPLNQTYRGMMLDDFASAPYGGKFVATLGIYNVNANQFTAESIFQGTFSCTATGYFNFRIPFTALNALYALPQIESPEANPLGESTYANPVIPALQLSVLHADLLNGISTGATSGASFAWLIPLLPADFMAIRIFAPQITHADFSAARSGIWTVGVATDGYLQATLLSGWIGVEVLQPQIRKRLNIRGTSPYVKADSTNSKARIAFVGPANDVQTLITKDQFTTGTMPDVIFDDLPDGTAVECCFCRDEATGALYFFAVGLLAVDGSAGIGGTFIRRYDGSGAPMQFTPNPDIPGYSTIWQNLLPLATTAAGRPYCQFIPPGRLVFGYGNYFYYSDDQGSTWTDTDGIGHPSLCNLPALPPYAGGPGWSPGSNTGSITI